MARTPLLYYLVRRFVTLCGFRSLSALGASTAVADNSSPSAVLRNRTLFPSCCPAAPGRLGTDWRPAAGLPC